MEGLLPILILWLIFSLVGKAKKAAAPNQAKKAPGQPARPVHRAPAKAAPEASPAARPTAPLHEDHAQEPFQAHMHIAEMDREGEGTEGIDCCHDFMLSPTEVQDAPEFLPLAEEDEQERSRALLQGVVFSEILGRRPQRRYGGRQA